MLSDSSDPHRGQRGRHHDRHRSAVGDGSLDHSIAAIVVLGASKAAVQVAAHLALCLSAILVIWDLEDGSDEIKWPSVEVIYIKARVTDDPSDAVMGADLLIIDAEHEWSGSKASRLAEATGRPVLAVPANASDLIGSKVAVVWDGTPSAARATRDALPLMRDASSICVIDSRRPGRDRSKGSSAVLLLERHDCEAFEIDLAGKSLADIVSSQRIDFIVGVPNGSAEELARSLNIPVLVSS